MTSKPILSFNRVSEARLSVEQMGEKDGGASGDGTWINRRHMIPVALFRYSMSGEKPVMNGMKERMERKLKG